MDDKRHQWLLLATYEFTEEELVRMHESKESVGLRFDHLLSVTGPGCFRCEQTWHEAKGKPCPGGEDRLPKENLKITRLGLVEEFERRPPDG